MRLGTQIRGTAPPSSSSGLRLSRRRYPPGWWCHNGTTIALRVGASGNPKYLLSDPHGAGQVVVVVRTVVRWQGGGAVAAAERRNQLRQGGCPGNRPYWRGLASMVLIGGRATCGVCGPVLPVLVKNAAIWF